jgi:hypothetical protein
VDDIRIDELARCLESRISRRGLGGIATGALAALGVTHVTDAKKKKKKKKKKGGTGGPSGGGGGNTCQKQCSGKTCGGDGCGGSCGACGEGTECVEGVCENYVEVTQRYVNADDASDAVFDASGNLYVLNSGREIIKFPAGGGNSTRFPVGGDVEHLASDGTNLYVTALTSNKVRVYSTSGTLVKQWGTSGTGAGQLDLPATLAVADGYVYVRDGLVDSIRVQRFDAMTGANAKLMSPPPGGWEGAFRLAAGGGELFVGDADALKIHRSSSSGAFVQSLGGPGSGRGQFTRVNGLTLDDRGQLVVVDGKANRFQVLTRAGVFVAEHTRLVPPGEFAYGVTANGSNLLVLSEENEGGNPQMTTYRRAGASARDPRSSDRDQTRSRRHVASRRSGRHAGGAR